MRSRFHAWLVSLGLPKRDLPLRLRIFQLVSLVIPVLCLLVVEPANIFQNLPVAVHLCVLVLGLIGAFFYWESLRGRHHMRSCVLLLVMVLDLMWFWNAGSQGSVTYFFFPLLLFAQGLFRGRTQWLVVVGLLLNVLALLVLEHAYPGLVTPFKTNQDRFIDHATGLAVSLGVSAVVAYLILMSHDREKDGIAELAAKLSESEQIYRQIFNAGSDALMIYDSQGQLIDFNERACSLFGFDRATGMKLSINDRSEGVSPYSGAEVLEKIRWVMAGHPQVFEWRSRRQNGELFWSEVAMRACEIAGQSRVIGAIRDISDRKRSEEDLRLNEERLRLSMLASEQGWFELNVQTGQGISSPEYLRIIEQNPASFKTNLEDWISGIHPEDRDRVVESFRTYVASGETGTIEYRRQTRSGNWKWLRSVGKIVAFDAAGRPLRMCGTHADITERKALESRLLHSQRLEAVGRFASGVAHDLNNILTPLLLVTSLIRDKMQSPQDQELLTLLESGGKRGAAIIRQLLAFSQNLPENRVHVLPLSLVKEAALLLRATLPGNIRVQSPETSLSRHILVDPTQIHQVLMNLCLNARDAMPEGGTLSLAIDWVENPETNEVRNEAAKAGTYLVLTVSDTGHGIDPQDLQRVFDPFFTTKDVGKGTGLGLASVYGIVKARGGFVRVESVSGQGATFRVYLPASPESPRSPAAVSVPSIPANSGRGEGILVVDDETAVRTASCQILSRQGYQVLEAEGGAAALRLLESAPFPVRLVTPTCLHCQAKNL